MPLTMIRPWLSITRGTTLALGYFVRFSPSRRHAAAPSRDARGRSRAESVLNRSTIVTSRMN
eukprot:5652087-Pyramimonas_sp.AAC.1